MQSSRVPGTSAECFEHLVYQIAVIDLPRGCEHIRQRLLQRSVRKGRCSAITSINDPQFSRPGIHSNDVACGEVGKVLGHGDLARAMRFGEPEDWPAKASLRGLSLRSNHASVRDGESSNGPSLRRAMNVEAPGDDRDSRVQVHQIQPFKIAAVSGSSSSSRIK